MSGNHRKRAETTNELVRTILECRKAVELIARGDIVVELVQGTHARVLRYAPSFREGLPLTTNGVRYTITHVAEAVHRMRGGTGTKLAEYGAAVFDANGKGVYRVSRWIRLSMAILAGIEEGWIDEQYLFERIRGGASAHALYEELYVRRNNHREEFEVCQREAQELLAAAV